MLLKLRWVLIIENKSVAVGDNHYGNAPLVFILQLRPHNKLNESKLS